MADLLQVSDLEKAKKHDTFHSEVVTGKAGGVSTGANIDYATNAVTGQVQKTLPKILDDLDWSYVGLFADGVTFTDKTDFAVDAVGTQWIYTGSLPFSATAGTVPSEPTYQAVHVTSSYFSNWRVTTVGDVLDQSIRKFDSILDLQDAISINEGDIVQIQGNLTLGDISPHYRIISNSDDGSGISVSGMYANILTTGWIKASWLCGVFTNTYLLSLDEIEFENDTIDMSLGAQEIIPNFTGTGIVNVTDIFANVHVCKVENLSILNKYPQSFSAKLNNKTVSVNIGFTGDSITDGADATGWVANPTTGDAFTGNLSSTNYNHSASGNGGYVSWAARFGRYINSMFGITVNVYNTASSAKNIVNGWAYRNIDYGFFQNSAYQNEVPELVVSCFGMNDTVAEVDAETYRQQIRDYIRKLNFYGAEVMWVLPVKIPDTRRLTVSCIEEVCAEMGVHLLKSYKDFAEYEAMADYTFYELWNDSTTTVDLVHPESFGHMMLADLMFKDVFADRVYKCKRGGRIDPVRFSGAILSNVTALIADTANAYGRAYCSGGQSVSGAVSTIKIVVWCDDNIDLVASTVYHYPSAINRIQIVNGEATKTVNLPVLSSTTNQTLGYFPNRVAALRYGLNIITITVQSNASLSAEIPMLHFVESDAIRFGRAGTVTIGKPTLLHNNNDKLYNMEMTERNVQYAPFLGVLTVVDLSGLATSDFIQLFSTGSRPNGVVSPVGSQKYAGVQLISGTYKLVDISNGGTLYNFGATPVFSFIRKTDGVYVGQGDSLTSPTLLSEEWWFIDSCPMVPMTRFTGVRASIYQKYTVVKGNTLPAA